MAKLEKAMKLYPNIRLREKQGMISLTIGENDDDQPEGDQDPGGLQRHQLHDHRRNVAGIAAPVLDDEDENQNENQNREKQHDAEQEKEQGVGAARRGRSLLRK
jgi:hypothetical protein